MVHYRWWDDKKSDLQASTETSGPVDSVNGHTGTVTLVASDVGAQPVDSDLTAIAALTTTAFGRGLLALANSAALAAALIYTDTANGHTYTLRLTNGVVVPHQES